MNWEVLRNIYDGKRSEIQLISKEPYTIITCYSDEDTGSKANEEVIAIALDDFFKRAYVDKAMPEVIQKVDNTVKTVGELKELIANAEVLISKLKQNQDNINKAFVLQSDLSEEQKALIMSQFPIWEVGKDYKQDDVLQYQDTLYRVLQAHKSQSDWTPDKAVSLFTVFKGKTIVEDTEVIQDFVQPTGSHDSYQIGDKVAFEGKVYESIIANNAYSPTAYPQGWKEVSV